MPPRSKLPRAFFRSSIGYGVTTPPRVRTVLNVLDGLTWYLNEESGWFKTHEDRRVNQTYDIVKDAAAAVRGLWLKSRQNGRKTL